MEFLVNVSLLLMVVAMTVGSLSNYQGLDFSGPSDYHGRGSQLAHGSSTSPFNTANAFSGTPYSGGYNGEHQPHTASHTADQQPFGSSPDRRYSTGDNERGIPVTEYLAHGLFNFLQGNYYKGLPWSRDVLPDNLQSPVDIIKSQVQAINFAPLYVIYNPNQQMQCEVTNSGHGIQIKVINEEDRPYLVGGPLLTEYVFSNLHLHWGKTEAFGSEHFINGESYAMEGHLVTYKRTSGSVEAALLDKKKDGIVVLTFFGTISSSDNYKLNSLLDHVPKIVNGHAKTTVYDSDVLLWFLSTLDLNRGYYAYPGSLTTPPFTDAVQFFIMPNPIPISHRQLEILRTLKDKVGAPITSNRRELQPLFQRPIFYVNNQIRKMTLEEQVNQLHY